ncbi:MAG: hypothetical protein AMJ90_07440 [candidate division Zixibacteria bacterium SM23_73_2]|nr:MAG: hypothetical protein AMJ90_07440 [candidate division Zixibacteria bacterium SM23_73_2]
MSKKLLKPQTFLIPLPAVLISCQWGDEPPNIITLSWVGICCSEPPILSIAIRRNRFSHSIISRSKEFAVNLTSEEHLVAVDFCGTVSGRETDKFKKMSLTPVEGKRTKAPLIKECPFNLECAVRDVLKLGSHDLFLGEILAVHADPNYLDKNGKPDMRKFKPLIYCNKAQEYWGGLSRMLGRYGRVK